jgi:hypothetical protein
MQLSNTNDKVSDNTGLSTPCRILPYREFGCAHETGLVRRIGSAPQIQREPADHEEINHLGHAMPSFKGSVGGEPNLGPGVHPILGGMERFQLGLKPIATQQSRRPESDQQSDLELRRDLAEVKPFRQQMHARHDAANDLKMKITRDENLGDGPGVIRVVVRAQKAFHLLRERGEADSESEKERGTKPHRRVQNTNES